MEWARPAPDKALTRLLLRLNQVLGIGAGIVPEPILQLPSGLADLFHYGVFPHIKPPSILPVCRFEALQCHGCGQ